MQHLPTPQTSEILRAPAPRITDEEYEAFRKIIYDHSRINLGAQKKELVTARLTKRLRITRIESFAKYLKFIQSKEGTEEFTHFIDAISTNHTFFFRESGHYEYLNNRIFPDFLSDKLKWGKQLRLWSAAASSGEEPYSLAMTMAEALDSAHGKDWAIDCTDISTSILETARQGIYREDRVKKIDKQLLPKYFQRGSGSKKGLFRVKTSLKNKMRFLQLNLLQPQYPFDEPYHIIFNRNVMIYFDKETQEELIAKMAKLLVPGGYLFIGHAESLSGIKHPLKMVQPSIYRKT